MSTPESKAETERASAAELDACANYWFAECLRARRCYQRLRKEYADFRREAEIRRKIVEEQL